MSSSTNQSVGHRIVNALFDSPEAAKKAVDDLVAAGIPREHITKTADIDAAGAGADVAHRSFWDQLKGLFMPDDDRSSYAEGLRRGGTLVAVDADEANYTRVLDIMDTDGAVDLDRRVDQWRGEGWTHEAASATKVPVGPATRTLRNDSEIAAASAYDESGPTPSETNWRTDDLARAAALDGSVAATARAARDDSHGRARVRSYVVDSKGVVSAGDESAPLSP